MMQMTKHDDKMEQVKDPGSAGDKSDSLQGNTSVHDSKPTEAKQGISEQDDVTPRKKIIQTAVLYMSVFDLALVGCMIGPSLLDLELLTNSDTATIAMVFLGRGLGSMIGNILSGFVMDKVNFWLFVSAGKLLGGLFCILIPLCRNVPQLFMSTISSGLVSGLAEAGCNKVILLIWGEDNGPVVQGFHFMHGLGCMLAPLVVEPFLLKRPGDSEDLNESVLFSNRSEAVAENTSSLMNNLTQGSAGTTQDSQVFYGYLIGGCVAFITCICSFNLFLKSNENMLLWMKTNDRNELKSTCTERRTRMCLWVFFLVMLSAFYFSILGLEMSLSGYLMTFSVRKLGWSKSHGALVTTVFLGAHTFGRGAGIVIIKYIPPTLLLFGDLLLCNLFSLAMVLFVNMHWSVLWICAVGLGIGISTIVATGFTLTEKCVGVNNKAICFILVGSALGEIGGPVIVGQLFDKVSMMSFTYVLMSFSVGCLLIMVPLQCTGWKLKILFKRRTNVVSPSRPTSGEAS